MYLSTFWNVFVKLSFRLQARPSSSLSDKRSVRHMTWLPFSAASLLQPNISKRSEEKLNRLQAEIWNDQSCGKYWKRRSQQRNFKFKKSTGYRGLVLDFHYQKGWVYITRITRMPKFTRITRFPRLAGITRITTFTRHTKIIRFTESPVLPKLPESLDSGQLVYYQSTHVFGLDLAGVLGILCF